MIELARKILREYRFCDHCLGRQFAQLGYGLGNDERGKIIKDALVLELIQSIDDEDNKAILQNIADSRNQIAIRALEKNLGNNFVLSKEFDCELCNNIFTQMPNYLKKVLKRIAREDFATFLLGAKIYPEIIKKEEELRETFAIETAESIKSEFTRELGKTVSKELDKEVDFKLPDITIIIDLPKNKIVLEKRSIFIFGHYNKYIRTIPQTKWPCYDCNGKGCENCNFTGKKYSESVEELIAKHILKVTKSKKSKFHGAGREDIDALMLGNGRPFVLEIIEPNQRSLDLSKLQRKINRRNRGKVAVSKLAFTNKKMVRKIKKSSETTKKTYRATVEFDDKITKEDIVKIERELKGTTIKQQTPLRVLHRRADLIRKKKVFEIETEFIDSNHIIATITGQGGLYIKELISGDNNRTKPSFTSIMGSNARCTQLDVIYLHFKKQ